MLWGEGIAFRTGANIITVLDFDVDSLLRDLESNEGYLPGGFHTQEETIVFFYFHEVSFAFLLCGKNGTVYQYVHTDLRRTT